MAAELKKATGTDVQLVVGTSGEFTVWVGDRKVAEKTGQRFPEPSEVIAAVRAAQAS